MKVRFDIDDVLWDFVSPLSVWHNKRYGTNLDRNKFWCYYFWKIWGGKRGEAIDKVAEFIFSTSVYNMEPMPGAVEVIGELGNKHELHVVTSRSNGFKRLTPNWLSYHFPLIFSEVHFRNSYDPEGGSEVTKLEICETAGIELLVEDNLDHAIPIANFGRTILLYDSLWNQIPDEDLENILRVYSWVEIGAYLPEVS